MISFDISGSFAIAAQWRNFFPVSSQQISDAIEDEFQNS